MSKDTEAQALAERDGSVRESLMDRIYASRISTNLFIIGLILLVAVPLVGIGVFATHQMEPIQAVSSAVALPSEVVQAVSERARSSNTLKLYLCSAGKFIEALVADNMLTLRLSDGRQLSIPRTISSYGVRFTNPDGSFVFFDKGSGVSIEENHRVTYENCTDS